MAKLKLNEDDFWEVIDAGLIALGYVNDRSHDVTLHRAPTALTVHEPNTHRVNAKANAKFLTRERAFAQYRPGGYKDGSPPTVLIEYCDVHVKYTNRVAINKYVFVATLILGLLAYNLLPHVI